MKNHWFAALLCIVFAFAATGCGTPRAGAGEKKGRRATPQTGTNIPRWQSDGERGRREPRGKQRIAKPKREKPEPKKPKVDKPKRERQQRRARAGDEEVITRGGFR